MNLKKYISLVLNILSHSHPKFRSISYKKLDLIGFHQIPTFGAKMNQKN